MPDAIAGFAPATASATLAAIAAKATPIGTAKGRCAQEAQRFTPKF